MKSFFLYNNEAIATVALGHFMSLHNRIEATKALLVLPFVLHDQSVHKLNGTANKRSMEEFIAQYPHCVANFNSRFLDNLPFSINAITILSNSSVVFMKGDAIIYNSKKNFRPTDAGKRLERIKKANAVLSNLFSTETPANLYLKLKVHL